MQAAEEYTLTVDVGPSAFYFPRLLCVSLISLQEHKQSLRDKMRTLRRDKIHTSSLAFSGLSELFIREVELEPHAVVASYSAFGGEMDPTILEDALRCQGHPIALPVMKGKADPLQFRLYERGDKLCSGPMGIMEPSLDASLIEPDILLVPLLAFDQKRNRLGYGGGYYDRTLRELRARKPIRAIGIAFACQEVGSVPIGPNDIKLDKIVTELNVF